MPQFWAGMQFGRERVVVLIEFQNCDSSHLMSNGYYCERTLLSVLLMNKSLFMLHEYNTNFLTSIKICIEKIIPLD